MKNNLVKSLCWAIAVLILISAPVSAISIGISPAQLAFDSVLKGGYAEKIVTISTAEAQPIACELVVGGPFANWTTLDPAGNWTVSRDMQLKVRVIVQPPNSTANGSYSGSIAVTARPLQSGIEGATAGAVVAAGAAASMTVEVVGDEVKQAEVKSIDVKATEEGHPLEVAVAVLNTGNVIIYPLIAVDVLSQDKSIVLKSAEHGQDSVLPTKMTTIRTEVPLDDLEVGQYWAVVSVWLDAGRAQKLAEQTLSFDLLAKGSLSIKGVLKQVWAEPWVFVGDVVKVTAYFENTGELSTSAKFKGEVSLAGRLLTVFESEQLEVPVGREVALTAYFPATEPGRYVVTGHVLYAGKTTETKETIVNVNAKPETPKQSSFTSTNLVVWAAILIAITALVALKKQKRSFMWR